MPPFPSDDSIEPIPYRSPSPYAPFTSPNSPSNEVDTATIITIDSEEATDDEDNQEQIDRDVMLSTSDLYILAFAAIIVIVCVIAPFFWALKQGGEGPTTKERWTLTEKPGVALASGMGA
ncbi:hypothetical protein BJ508DRAFT_137715 [Ascobolus immersus RN42]|uniref:Transmembrane protein n=1 Tax=Ascobolus immersus RN42 TaxID=1160509 RepID=A0A3N4I4U3_ASCIM|nr:hypothetical protein BJ508DRAFT_137715 [Ascobolus immersus RN42]